MDASHVDDSNNGFIIEELDSSNLPAEELAKFQEVNVVLAKDYIEQNSIPSEEATRFIAALSENSQQEQAAESLQLRDREQEVDRRNVITAGLSNVDEATLINRYVHGESEFPDHLLKLSPEEVASDEALSNDSEVSRDSDDSTDDVEQQPTTSRMAATIREEAKAAAKTSKASETSSRKSKAKKTSASLTSTPRPRPAGQQQRRRTVLDSALQGFMGQANLAFVRGQYKNAEKICLEIIRQNPMAAEPFVTLAEIYENTDSEKYLNYLTIAAHLNNHDRDQWVRIVDLNLERGNMVNARVHYTKAIKALPKDYDLRLRKGQLLEQMNDTFCAMNTYLKMIPHVPVERADLCLSTAKRVAKYFYNRGKNERALEAMESAYKVCSRFFEPEDTNLYLELLILNKLYNKALHVLSESTSVDLEMQKENNEDVVASCSIPDNLIPEFRSKLCVCLIQIGVEFLGYLIQNLHEFMPPSKDNLNFYMDIAEALMSHHKYVEAIKLMRPIIEREEQSGDLAILQASKQTKKSPPETADTCPPFVWLRHGECLRNLNQRVEAIESYRRVLLLAPHCYEAKFTLAALLKQQGRYAEAIKALDQTSERLSKSADGQAPNLRLLYERVLLLQEFSSDVHDCLRTGYKLLARTSLQVHTREELKKLTNAGAFYSVEGIRVALQMQNICADADKLLQEYTARNQYNPKTAEITIYDEYDLFLKLIRIAFQHRKFSYCERLCIALMASKRFTHHHPDLERITLLACYFNDDCDIAFSYLRELIRKAPTNASLWNMLNALTQKDQNQRYVRFIRRLLNRHPHLDLRYQLLICNYSMHCSSYKYALRTFFSFFDEQPMALVALSITACFQQLSLQKRTMRKLAGVGQALVFASKYVELRRKEIGCRRVPGRCGNADNADITDMDSDPADAPTDDIYMIAQNSYCCPLEQEICYNLGRFLQQANMISEAIFCYERGMSMSKQHSQIASQPKYDLTRHIAYNLHTMYRKTGNMIKARDLLLRYIIY